MTDKDYTWTFADVRSLDDRLYRLEATSKAILHDIAEIKTEMAKDNHLVVDNRSKTDWKAIAVLIGATISIILGAIVSVVGSK